MADGEEPVTGEKNIDLSARLDAIEERLTGLEKIINGKFQVSIADKAFYESLHNHFLRISGVDGRVDLAELKEALQLRDIAYAERIFRLFDHDNDGYIDEDEFLLGVEKLVYGSDEDRLRFAFNLYDLDGSGFIGKAELLQILDSCLNENQLRFSSEQIRGLSDLLFGDADADADGSVSFSEFKALMSRNPRIQKQSTFSSITWLRPASKNSVTIRLSYRQKATEKLMRWFHYLNNNRALVCFALLYVVVNVFLFVHAVNTYAGQGANRYVQIARGCGACLNFNGALILVPMLRHYLTWLRGTAIGSWFPLDHHVDFHKAIAHVMFALSIVHTVAHLLNYSTLPQPVLTSLLHTKAGLSGLLLSAVFLVMWFFALERVRRSGHFELFYITHFAFVFWFALALIHGPVFWQWVTLPLLAYVIERIYRAFNTRKPVKILKAELFPSRVTSLEFEKPAGFKQKSGDYVFIKIPSISRYEWHPFTLTNSPDEDKLSVHIRSAGNWTSALNQHFSSQRDADGSKIVTLAGSSDNRIYIDGPYGTPSVDVMDSEVAILIGAGIGVTPFAAILKTILLAVKNNRRADIKIRKVHFVWLNRTQESFEWFSELLKELEAEDKTGLVESNIYMTSGKTDITASMLNLAMDLSYRFTNIDLVTGFSARTHFGRPNWERLFGDIAKSEKGKKVDVFFCGAPVLAKQLERHCNKFKFYFHKENF